MSEFRCCDNCRFWDEVDDREGFCRINPPVVFLTEDCESETRWPRTDSYDWCGKHETPKKEKSDESAS